ncbi:MAG: hypothetical protein PHS96_13995 [Anaerolineales bacterium]|nr:hypothetical protein [Anaerolineales bacterium]
MTQRSYPGALFFSAGGYHHHVAVNTWAGRGIPPAPTDAAGLISFQLDLGDEAARAALLQRLEAEGVAFEDAQCSEASTMHRIQGRDGLRIEF